MLRIGIDIHTVGSNSGGNETFYRQLVGGLRRASDHEFFLYYMNPAGDLAFNDNPNFHFARLIPRTPVLRIPVSLPFYMRRDRLDVFHAQYIVPPYASCKTIVSIFDLAHERFPEFFHPVEARRSRLLVRWSAQRADHVLTVSHFSARDLSEIYGVAADKITVAYLAPSEEFHPLDRSTCQEAVARKYGLASEFIVYIGRLQARKNLMRLLEAYNRVRAKGYRGQLVLVGKQDWKAGKLLARVADLGLGSAVRFLGYVPRADLPILCNAAQVFAYPSIFEGFGLPVVESMACGTPTMTSYGSSLEEVAGNGALLVDPLSVDSITAALEKLLANEEFRKQLGRRGLERSAQFKYHSLANSTLQSYARIAGA